MCQVSGGFSERSGEAAGQRRQWSSGQKCFASEQNSEETSSFHKNL